MSYLDLQKFCAAEKLNNSTFFYFAKFCYATKTAINNSFSWQ